MARWEGPAGAGSRAVTRVIHGTPAMDGAGVRLTRYIGTPELAMLDPFLLLDAFRSDRPQDYIAGFPAHPHRGFETFTYLFAGRVRHRDTAGHAGVIGPGGMQWMTAGRGVVHSEMPEQEAGLLAGIQLWVNLPARHKLCPPAYQEHEAADVPVERSPQGSEARVLVGRTARGTRGPVSQPLTQPLLLDVTVVADGRWEASLPSGHNAFVLLIEGGATLPALQGESIELGGGELAVLARGDRLVLDAGSAGARLVLAAGRPLNEPLVRRGPFVMSTEAELRQAEWDYLNGRMA